MQSRVRRFLGLTGAFASEHHQLTEEPAAVTMNDSAPIDIPGINDVDLLILNDLVSSRIAEVDVRIDSEHLTQLIALKEKIITAAMKYQRALHRREFQSTEE